MNDLTIDPPACAGNAAIHAKRYISQVQASTGVLLDYSVESLKYVDQALATWRAQRKNSAQVAETLFQMGCFAGEVLERKRSGVWVDAAFYPEQAGTRNVPYVVGLRFSDGHIWKPIRIAIERLDHGSALTLEDAYRQELERPVFPQELLQHVGDLAGKMTAGYVAQLISGQRPPVRYGACDSNGQCRYFELNHDQLQAAVDDGMKMLSEKGDEQVKALVFKCEIGAQSEREDAVAIAFGNAPRQVDGIILAVPLRRVNGGRRYEAQPLCAIQVPDRMRCMVPDVLEAVIAGAKKTTGAWQVWYDHMAGVHRPSPDVPPAPKPRSIAIFSGGPAQPRAVPEALMQASRLAGQVAAMHMLALTRGEETHPRFAAMAKNGQVSVSLITKDFMAAIEEGRSKRSSDADDLIKLLVFDAGMAVATGVDSSGEPVLETTSALLVEFGNAPQGADGLVLAVPFRNAEASKPFIVMPVQVMQSPESLFDHHDDTLSAFMAGAAQNVAAWPTWQTFLRPDLAPSPAIANCLKKKIPDPRAPGVFWMSVDHGAPQPLDLRIDIAAAVAGLGPQEQDYAQIERPSWMDRPSGIEPDGLLRLFDDYPILLREGRVVWGHMIQANSELFEAGRDDLPAEFLYAPAGLAPVELLPVAHQLSLLKGTLQTDPALKQIADHLAAELTREFALPVPPSMTGGRDMLMSTLFVCRKHLPNGRLSQFFMPVLISERCPGSVMILPSRWWPHAFVAIWGDNAPAPSAPPASGPSPEEEQLKKTPTPEEYKQCVLAAKQGQAAAQYQLAVYYLNGISVTQNSKQGAYWLGCAARQGHAGAQFSLGVLHYIEGGPVEHDRAAAAGWFRKAAAQGHEKARMHLQIMGVAEYEPQTDEEPIDPETADGRFRLGRQFEEVHKNLSKAARWYGKAAEMGHTEARFELGMMTLTGSGVRRDLAKAATMLEQAAESGHAAAQFELGALYAAGEGVEKNPQAAQAWYEKAAAQGHSEAKSALAGKKPWWKVW